MATRLTDGGRPDASSARAVAHGVADSRDQTLPSDPPAIGHRPGRGFAARLFARVLDRIDRGLVAGRLEGHLPDGSVRVLGGRAAGPQVVVRITDWRALVRLALAGSAGWYRAWTLGEWDSPDRVALFALFMRNARTLGGAARARGPVRLMLALAHRWRRNTARGARRNILAHYDLGNAFYAAWLDAGMTYSSALDVDRHPTLEAAQDAKYDALIARLALRDGQRLLEIGCGWGGLGDRVLARGGLSYDGVTISPSQAAYARARLAPHGDRATIIERDYRALDGRYDAIVSVEMVEAVGVRYWPAYLDAVRDRLVPGGRAAIQFIAIDDALFDAYAASADFIQTHVFPGGCLIATDRFRALAEARGLRWSDERRFGHDYARTLAMWRGRFDAAVAERRLPPGFDDRFIALWRYYLDYCQGGFEGGGIWVTQVTLHRAG